MSKKMYLIIVAVVMAVIAVGVAVYAIQNSNRSSVSDNPKSGSITLEGTMTCLVPKDTSGVQDLSCAIGLKADDGKYYALGADDPTITGTIPTGQRVKVKGSFASQNSKYTMEGIIQVESIERI
jgi:hypothetical protein